MRPVLAGLQTRDSHSHLVPMLKDKARGISQELFPSGLRNMSLANNMPMGLVTGKLHEAWNQAAKWQCSLMG